MGAGPSCGLPSHLQGFLLREGSEYIFKERASNFSTMGMGNMLLKDKERNNLRGKDGSGIQHYSNPHKPLVRRCLWLYHSIA